MNPALTAYCVSCFTYANYQIFSLSYKLGTFGEELHLGSLWGIAVVAMSFVAALGVFLVLEAKMISKAQKTSKESTI